MELNQLKSILFEYISNKDSERMLYEWQKTADEIGIKKSQLEYVVSEMGEDYFTQHKSGFFTTNKAFIEAKYNIKENKPLPIVNIIGDNNLYANQSSLDNAFISPKKETTKINNPQQNKKGSFIEKLNWIIAIVGGIVTIYYSCK